jgi:hypothetical protein
MGPDVRTQLTTTALDDTVSPEVVAVNVSVNDTEASGVLATVGWMDTLWLFTQPTQPAFATTVKVRDATAWLSV